MALVLLSDPPRTDRFRFLAAGIERAVVNVSLVLPARSIVALSTMVSEGLNVVPPAELLRLIEPPSRITEAPPSGSAPAPEPDTRRRPAFRSIVVPFRS